MTEAQRRAFFVAVAVVLATGVVSIAAEEEGFAPLFDGKTLSGWTGDAAVWSVVDGVITGRNTAEAPVKHNTFLIHEKPVADFELRLSYKIVGGNSGIQYRSKVHDAEKFIVGGYQADFEAGKTYSGILYEERGRGILAQRGHKVAISADGKKTTEKFAETGELQSKIKHEDWNEYRIVAAGPKLQHYINGALMSETIDEQEGKRATEGVVAFQVHAGPPMTVQFKDIRIKRTGPDTATSQAAAGKPAAPQWVWADRPGDAQTVRLRKPFTLNAAVKSATLTATADNSLTVYINGKKVLTNDAWEQPVTADVASALKAGENVIAIEAGNENGPAGLIAGLTITTADNQTQHVVTDGSWKLAQQVNGDWQAPGYNDGAWKAATVLGAVGDASLPWTAAVPRLAGQPAAPIVDGAAGVAPRPAEGLQLAEGFKAELLYSVPKNQGSWVSLTVDDKGRLYASDQGGAGLYLIEPARIGQADAVTTVRKLPVNISAAQGLCWINNSLYAVTHSGGGGLHRLTDTDGDGLVDKSEPLGAMPGGGEHGPHAVIPAPDGKSIYVCAGNHTRVPPQLNGSRLPTNWAEDLLVGRQWDANGHARGVLAPGGWIAKVSFDGSHWELVSSGYRNQYDIAFNGDGELFTFDADMEWDMGMPWYRPTRVNHATSGSEFGWRSGTGKWPAYREDSLPATIDIGPGSPTGVASGTGAKFPAKYQKALYINDWTFGTMYAIHLTPDGSTYSATKQEFVSGKPLPLTDLIIGTDGAMYFAVGGRGTQSALYRVTYSGSEPTTPVQPEAVSEPRKIRHTLEAFHGKKDAAAVAAAWPHLAHADRFIRYAARVAIENQPVDTWRSKAVAETNPQAAALAMMALSRQGAATDLPGVLEALGRIDMTALDADVQLDILRAYQLAFLRLGKPDDAARQRILAKLDPLYPTGDDRVNAEMAQVLVHLDSPTVVRKTIAVMIALGPETPPAWGELITRNQGYGGPIARMMANMPPLRKIDYAFTLRNAKVGWTPADRRSYFDFFAEASKHPGGNSYGKFLNNIRDEAMSHLSEQERKALADVTGIALIAQPTIQITPPKGPGRAWTAADAAKAVGGSLKGASFEGGRNLFHATACFACHRFNGEGGAIGPDLSTVANKFSRLDLLESIIEPSKVISDQYGSQIVTTTEGAQHAGRVIESGDRVQVFTHDPAAPPIAVPKGQVKSIEASPVSQMPPGLINTLSEAELRDLVAYLLSGGDPNAEVYRK